MFVIGQIVITVVMLCAVAGALAAIRNDEKGLGKEFLEGLHAIGYIFVPVAGIMASGPLLTKLIQTLVGPLYQLIGADPSLAATSLIAVDMGGYQVAHGLAQANPEHWQENWIMAMFTGYMAGATIVFSIPVGLSLLEKRDHKYMALGVMSGLLSIPVGVFVASSLTMLLHPEVRTVIATKGDPGHELAMSFGVILINLVPLTLFVSLLALGLRLVPDAMIRGFMLYGRILGAAILLVVVGVIVEYFTSIFFGQGIFTTLAGAWPFDPVIADGGQINAGIKNVADADPGRLMSLIGKSELVDAAEVARALEVAGYIGLMLSGAFPMVYLIKKYLAVPMEKVGSKLGLEAAGAAGLLAAIANILAMFRLVKDMRPKDKVLNIAFATCAAFLFGDHLAFTANFQPNLILPVMLGKLSGGVCAFFLAYRLSVPKALELERIDAERAENGAGNDQGLVSEVDRVGV